MDKKFERKRVLTESSQYVKGVGPARQILLSRIGIENVEDLILHFPRKYYDRRNLAMISEIRPGADGVFAGTVLAISSRRLGSRKSILTVAAGDESGVINLVFFNQPYLEKQFKQGDKIIASGLSRIYRGQKQIVAPEYEVLTGELGDELMHTGRVVPVYPLTAGISQRMMRRIVKAALDKAGSEIQENLPEKMLKSGGMMSRGHALRQIHYPDSWEFLEEAGRRLKFEEIFYLHLLVMLRKKTLAGGKPRPEIYPPHELVDRFIGSLPFRMTSSQEKVLGEIRADVESKKGLSRLLQGDVGSGKTVVGLVAMLMAVGRGLQAAMMVPTEILAQQHFRKMKQYFTDLPVKIELLIGSLSVSEKKRIHSEIASGDIDLVVGTQALIQEGIGFRQLGLAVIDEQHRFGVKQRARLGQGELIPHFLVMTATPIPRSLAQTVYGDLDLSVIDELPFGKRRVCTEIVGERGAGMVYDKVRKGFMAGKQAFFLYPLVEESEKSDLKAAVDEFEHLQKEHFKEFPLGLLHGRMSFEEKSRAIDMVSSGEILGLVTTTGIEVGVDIPNASMLLINHPERFGLAQLHQLRGRVGRGGEEGECYLLTGKPDDAKIAERLEYFSTTADGFKVAEMDL
ncbi:MAG: ATP-dependent DNA helicase RecG, partial [Bacteroidales bacterium]|nr:ATP-dependent DNA helicase RecG [Candidatus Latescibacterota bacterium]